MPESSKLPEPVGPPAAALGYAPQLDARRASTPGLAI
jgi:hypothetical protein